METIKIFSNRFSLSECESDPDVLIGRFIICDFLPNKNDVQLDQATILDWLGTLLHKPLVGKIISNLDGTRDFSSHNMTVVTKTDDFGNEYKTAEFDTSAFGTFFEVSIETIDGVDCIVASAKIWKRFTEACEIMKSRAEEGELSTSWEISIAKKRLANYMGRVLKVIEKGCFFGHCLLNKDMEPAYDSSKLLDVATFNGDNALEEALINDMCAIAQKEENNLEHNKTGNPNETSALTDFDLRVKIAEACRAKVGEWCWVAYHFPTEKTVWAEKSGRATETDFLLFTYEVSNDEVTVSDPSDVKLCVCVSQMNAEFERLNNEIAQKDGTIVTLNTKVNDLTTEVSTLSGYKEQFETAERDGKESKLRDTLLSSKVVTAEEIETSEEIKELLSNLDEPGINSFIVSRIVAMAEAGAETPAAPEVATSASAKPANTVKARITDGDPAVTGSASASDMIKKILT